MLRIRDVASRTRTCPGSLTDFGKPPDPGTKVPGSGSQSPRASSKLTAVESGSRAARAGGPQSRSRFRQSPVCASLCSLSGLQLELERHLTESHIPSMSEREWCPGYRVADRVQSITAFLNLLPDSRLRKALHASAFIKAPARRGVGDRRAQSRLTSTRYPTSRSVSFNERPYRQQL